MYIFIQLHDANCFMKILYVLFRELSEFVEIEDTSPCSEIRKWTVAWVQHEKRVSVGGGTAERSD
jgi:hypothetical protein